MATTTSGFLQLNLRDFARGLMVAVGAAVVPAVQEAIAAGGVFDWKKIGLVALSAFVSYIGLNLFSSKKVIVDGKPQ